VSARRVQRHQLAEPVRVEHDEWAEQVTTWSPGTPVCVLAYLGAGGAEVRMPDDSVLVLDVGQLADRPVPRRSRAKGSR
jgi:hypothetical protein